MKISADFQKNVDYLKDAIKLCPDYIINEMKRKDGSRVLLLCIDNMINSQIIYDEVIPRVLEMEEDDFAVDKLPFAKVVIDTNLDDALAGVATGGTFFLSEGSCHGFEVRVELLVGRMPASSENEKNIRGSRDSFVENLNINIAMMRTKIGNHNLKFEETKIGKSTNQRVMIGYLKGIADPELLKKLKHRITSIDFDGFPATGYLQQMISDHPRSPFPQCEATERTDKTVAALLEGKFAIFVNGAPMAVILPTSFWSFFHAVDDFTHSPWVGSLTRFFRFIALAITLFLPSLYITILSFDFYLAPIAILSDLTTSRSLVIFSPLVEAIIMEFLFEIIRESSIRLPTYVGSTLGIVGGIIIGQAAVEVGLVSNYMVIIVSITAIAGFVIPNQDMSYAVRFVRLALMLFSGFFGFIGLIVASALLMMHLIQLESLGRPYLLPLFPVHKNGWGDVLIRVPFIHLTERPNIAKPKDRFRGTRNGKK